MTFIAADRFASLPHTSSGNADADHVWRLFLPLAAAAAYQWLLCLGTSFGLSVSQVHIAGFEVVLLLMICTIGRFAVAAHHMGAMLALMLYMSLLWVFRGGEVDFKPLRDIAVVLIAFWYGTRIRQSVKVVDRCVLVLAIAFIGIGLLEYTSFYSRFINTFDYYARVGAIDPSSAMTEGQTVTLNGLRPEGIGRTLLPSFLGQERISSVFLEPVSMGNFGVIIAAWGIAKPSNDWKMAVCLFSAALLIITLADSRFGIVTISLMAALRIALHVKLATVVAFALPMAAAIGTVLTSAITNQTEDNFAGRLSYSGKRLLELDGASLLGISSFNLPYWDSGYAYVITRFGLALLVIMWIGFFLIRGESELMSRLRVNISVYLSLILCISGSSAFAFKTSVILWILFGMSTVLRDRSNKVINEPTHKA